MIYLMLKIFLATEAIGASVAGGAAGLVYVINRRRDRTRRWAHLRVMAIVFGAVTLLQAGVMLGS